MHDKVIFCMAFAIMLYKPRACRPRAGLSGDPCECPADAQRVQGAYYLRPVLRPRQ